MIQRKFVCTHCFEDTGLISFIEENAVAPECSYCDFKGSEPIAASVEDVSKHFLECLFQEYDLSVNGLIWMSPEREWIGTSWDADDFVLEEIGLEFPQDNHYELLPDLLGGYYEEEWCERDPYGLNDQEYAKYSWEHFCWVVMHQRRFFFLRDEKGPKEYGIADPGQVLKLIFEYTESLDLFREVPPGYCLYRARREECNTLLNSAEELGPIPEEKAFQSNRMSPAGIPMFYGCDDEETALKETASDSGCFAIGRFETLRPMTILDLTVIPPVPGLFEAEPYGDEVYPRGALKFLHQIVGEFSRPIERGNRVHVEYVPTQVVTEFIRDRLAWEDCNIDGIKYASSVNPGHASYVIFATQADVLATPENEKTKIAPLLKLTQVEHRFFGQSGEDIVPGAS